jgi:hypothetical protein
MSRRPWFFRVALLAAWAALTGPASSLWAAPAPLTRKPKIEVVFVIDTTGSMGDWINICKMKFWALCNAFANTRPTPELKVGLVDYRDKGDLWITKVYDLRDDLDAVFADLQTFRADGGGDTPEHVNQALFDAVHKIKWSTDRHTMRLIYLIGDAPAHMDYTDDVKYPVTCKEAVKRGIIINTIQCGTDNDCTVHWKDIATLGGGSYMQLSRANTVRPLTAPQDRRLQEINSELVRSIIVWGNSAKRTADLRKVREVSNLAEAAAADRISVMVRENRISGLDLLDSMRAGKVKLESLKPDELPLELQKLSPKERREHIEKVAVKRAALIKEALDLDRKRTAHLAGVLSRGGANFDGPVLDMLRRQGKKFRLRY